MSQYAERPPRVYMPAPEFVMEFNSRHKAFETHQKPIYKVPIEQLTRPETYPNELDEREAFRILAYFDRSRWEPVYIDTKYNLLDGQHRLWVAKKMGYYFIDAFMMLNDKTQRKSERLLTFLKLGHIYISIFKKG